MTFSPLISGTVPHHNKFHNRQGTKVTRIIQHHWAGTAGGDARLTNPNQQASTTYLVYTDGTIKGQVPEEYRAWTSGSFEADANAITIEVQNTGGAVNGNDNDPRSWPISDAALNAIIALVADIAKRHGFGKLTTGNYRGHREFQSTSCPGGYLWHRMDDIRAAVNGGKTPGVKPASKPKSKSVKQLADEVIAGRHGNGADRQRSLGSQYAAVQAEVDRRLLGKAAPAKPKPKAKSVAQLATEVIAGKHGSGDARKRALGSQYNAVQAEVNRRLIGGAPRAKSISQLADEVIAGKHGNGAQRQKSLGSRYAAVQAEVNRRYS